MTNVYMLQLLDLQLFAEGETANVTNVQSANEQTTSQSETSTTSATSETQEEQNEPTHAIQVDENGIRRLVRYSKPTAESDEDETEETAESDEVGNEAQEESSTEETSESSETEAEKKEPETKVVEYTPYEINEVDDIRMLDPKRIPKALQPAYKAMVQGMNRKFQEVAEQRKTLTEIAQIMKQEPQQQPSQQPSQQASQQISPDFNQYQNLHNAIKAEVIKELNIDPQIVPDSIREWTEPMQLAYQYKRDQVIRQLEAEQAKRNQFIEQQKTFDQNASSLETELLKADKPAFDYILAKIQNGDLPVREVSQIKDAITKNDKETINQFFNKYRDEFHGVKPKTPEVKNTKKAPVMEHSGKKPVVNQKPGINDKEYLKKFGSASPADKVKMIGEWRRSLGGK